MIVITTPTGTIGAAVAESLRARGESLRLIARDPSRLPDTVTERDQVVVGSHADPAVLDAALDGADALFVLVPPDFGARDQTEHYLGFARPIAAAVRAHGVSRVVAVSSLGRGYAGDAGVLSAAWAMDDVLETSGAAYRSVQPPFFMENLLHQVVAMRDHGAFVLTADPDEPHPAVATQDVSRVAATLLADRGWSGQSGVGVREPADHTPREMAAILSEALERPVAYRQATLGEYGAQLASSGASPATVDALVLAAAAQSAGVYPPLGDEVAGTPFRTWCLDVLAPAMARTTA